MAAFADWFKQQIAARDWTEAETARVCRIARSYVGKLKSGRSQPSARMIKSIAERLGVEVPHHLATVPPPKEPRSPALERRPNAGQLTSVAHLATRTDGLAIDVHFWQRAFESHRFAGRATAIETAKEHLDLAAHYLKQAAAK